MHKHIANQIQIGEPLILCDETDSTNDLIWNMAAKGLAEGTAVLAAFQRKGKGQGNARWESEAGANLLSSCYLRPSFLEAGKQFALNVAVSLAVCDFARLYLGNRVQLKWPNDIYYGDKKLGGILIENTIQGNLLCESVVGIGLNINQAYFGHAISNACSFTSISGQFYKLDALAELLFDKLSKRLTELKLGLRVQQHAEYLERLLGFGESRSFEYQNQLIKAVIVDVDAQGYLILDGPYGRMAMNNKEIIFRFDG
ncbi:MAG: biotin--[acetyl-CoA-carboxylase] ligase [Bacteroidia bacterium]